MDNEDRESTQSTRDMSRDPQREHRRIEEKIDKVILLLTGNGKPERGIIVRLDRLEQWRGQINVIFTPIFLILLGQFILFVIGLLLNRIEVRLP